MHNDKTWKQQLLKMSHLRIMQISKTIKTTTIRKRERGSGGERGEGRGETHGRWYVTERQTIRI